MNKIALGFSLFLVSSVTAFASSSASAKGDGDAIRNSPECAKVSAACEAAGFKPGAHKETGKGLWVDCIKPLADGKTIEGVTGITADEAKACADSSKDARKARRAAKKK